MYVLMSPCIRNPALRSRGITRDEDREWFNRAIERCSRFGIEIEPLPCPETLYLGDDREPGTYLDRLNTPEFSRLLDLLTREVSGIIADRGPPLCIVGVNSSPACGVDSTWFGPEGSVDGRRDERGVFLARFPMVPALDVADFARYRIYLAAPLFSDAEREYNRNLASLLREHLFEVYLPQDMGDDSHERNTAAHQEIFDRHLCALAESDLMVAVIDGADADSGTAWEIGYAYARGIPVISVRTDFRMAGHHELTNLMLERSSTVVRSRDELLIRIKSPRALPRGT